MPSKKHVYHVPLRWAVHWFAKGQWFQWQADDPTDHAAAQDFYDKLLRHGRQGVTLRCTNAAWPPPKRLTVGYRLEKRKIRVRSKKTGRRRWKVVKEKVEYDKMMEYNRRGWWWCPYCRKMRRFELFDGHAVEDKYYVPRKHYACPCCGISHTQVRLFNPIVAQLEFELEGGSRRGPSKRRKRRA